jgi:hypothetical protein
LQAETEYDMQQWIWAINYAQRRLPAKIDHSIRLHLLPKKQIMDTTAKNTQTHHSTSNIAFTPSPTVTDDPSELMMEKEPIFPFTTCALTSVMLQTAEVVDSEPTTPVTPISDTTATSWSMPWLTSSINVLSNTTPDETDIPSSQEKATTEPLIIWPAKIESDVPRPNLSRYSNTLEKRHRQLRKLFANVPDHELVLECW